MVTLTDEVMTVMRAHAERAWPEECVGALLGDGARLLLARPLENAASERHTGFLVSARDYLAAEAEAERRGLQLRGFYHSHPQGPAGPSAHDAAFARAEFFTVIIPMNEGVAALPRAFRFEHARFVEVQGGAP